MFKDQTLLLVDSKDHFLGEYAPLAACHTGDGLHHRAFVVLLENKKREVLIQKRRHMLWDGYWDVTATTHVLHLKNHDETYQEAAERALKREMGISRILPSNVGGFNYFARHDSYCENEYCAILVGEYNGEVTPDKDAVYEYRWVKKESFFRDSQKKSSQFTPWAQKTADFLQKHNIEIVPPITHLAFIMDGNRRWARAHGLSLFAGHKRGYKRIETVVNYTLKKNIPYVTFWAFSTENWNRGKKEVEYLMGIFRALFKSRWISKLAKKGARICVFGDITRFPKDIGENVQKIVDQTKRNTAITVNIALNYGGRTEILRAVNALISSNKRKVDESIFSLYLYSRGIPDPDLIVRTGGEQRLSGFLPWQSIYSELYFPKVYWPDFDEKEFDKALEEYKKRERRFGR